MHIALVAHSQEMKEAVKFLKEHEIENFNCVYLEHIFEVKNVNRCYFYLKRAVIREQAYITYLYLNSKTLYIIPQFKKIGFFYFMQGLMRITLEAFISPFVVFAGVIAILVAGLFTRGNIRNTKKVIYIRSDSWILWGKEGGCISHMKGIINAFKKLGFKVSYWGVDRAGVQPFLRNIPEVSEIFYNFYFILRFRYSGEGFIYTRLGLNDFKSMLLKALYRIPYLIEFNGSEIEMAKKWWRPLMLEFFTYLTEKTVLKNAAGVSCISEVALNEVKKYGAAGCLIPNGFDEDEFKKTVENYKKTINAEDRILVTLVSTFEYYHGADVLAQCIKYVVKKHKNVLFIFVGSGIREKIVREIIEKDGVKEFVVFTGILPHREVISILKSSDILVSPHRRNPDGSEFVGSPTKIFEYMAAGKAIVVSKLGQMGKIFSDSIDALLVEPDNPIQLAEKITMLIEDENLRKTLGENALKKSALYTWENNLKTLLKKSGIL